MFMYSNRNEEHYTYTNPSEYDKLISFGKISENSEYHCKCYKCFDKHVNARKFKNVS